MNAETIIIIPARYASTRFPGKPLVELKGASGNSRSLVKRSWDAACRVAGVDKVYVATDDDRIANAVSAFNGNVVMTSSECRNGTERCADAIDRLGVSPDIVVNFQGDAPLTPPDYVEALITSLAEDSAIDVTTPALETTGAHLDRLRAERRADRVGGTTMVLAKNGNALYFSKEVLPFCAKSFATDDITPVLHHIGVYAYRLNALRHYVESPIGELEQLEGLEQLRFLEAGLTIGSVKVSTGGRDFWEVNNPSDIEIVENIMKREGIE